MNPSRKINPFQALVTAGTVTQDTVDSVLSEAAEHRLPPATILIREHDVARPELLKALSEYYGCKSIEFDERLPIPPEFLIAMGAKRPAKADWFPVIKQNDGKVVIAAVDPDDPDLPAAVRDCLGPGEYEYRVTLPDDVNWYMLDFLHAPPGVLIGTERTGLAFWRNTMAQWRTLMACYRNDMAESRTALAFTRAGLVLITIAVTLMRSQQSNTPLVLLAFVILFGIVLCLFSLPVYFRIRRSRLSPPGHHTLVEVTAATLTFLENYHFMDADSVPRSPSKETMLARLGDSLADYSTILHPTPPSRERTHLARERNVLAAQRTIAACYRTIYSRARTGLALTRTGVSFSSIGIGFIGYFGLGINTLFDAMLIVVGLLMTIDGLLWYLPVRKEQAELPRARSGVLAE